MRKLFIALFALVGASTLLLPPEMAYADMEQAMMPETKGKVSRAARLRTAVNPQDPDTVWIGHVYQPSWDGPRNPALGDFTPTMPPGGYGPYHVGRGLNLPIKATGTIGDNGVWDFDRFQPGETDSLFGWWPIARAYQSGATTRQDYQRSFFGFDYGNQVNYVINQGAPKRTFGVTGLWHRDRGNTAFAPSDTAGGTNVQPVTWSPTLVGGAGSTASAWMGLRSHGDLSARDLASNGGTGNYFNAALMQHQGNNGFNQIGSVHVNGTDHNFPGYGSQMDQLLYRDIAVGSDTGPLTISFNFSTNMSLAKNTTTGVRAGWFDKDPLSNTMIGTGTAAPATADGNFISSDGAGANAPCDSFMVYVGAPVDDNAVTLSNGTVTTVYDKQRRWFSEVLKLAGTCASGSPCSIIGKELASYAGDNAPTSVSVDVAALYPAALNAICDADGVNGNGGVVRLVFRVKTNRGFDDENGGNPGAAYNSGTQGAAIVDNVSWTGSSAADGNFEATNAINNTISAPATTTWKSTGKPPAVYFHREHLSATAFDDPCGGVDDPERNCNMYGNVITSSDHDLGEKDGGLFGTNSQDRQRWFVSPTINLSATGNGVGNYNAMGIDDEVARTTGDYDCMFSYYNAGHVNATTETGNFISIGWQSYPARQLNGNICWGEARHTASIFFYGAPRACFETTALGGGAKFGGLIRTTNLENRPDSLRLYIHRISRCYSFTALTSATCSPTGGINQGTFFDNISVMLVDGAPPGAVTMSIWNLINDTFPANRNDAVVVPGTSFDTTAAHVRIGFNLAFQTGATRPNISGDSATVVSAGDNRRLDMVFRILPGPGNYVTIGNRASGVVQRPDDLARTAATSGDDTFFGEYMASAGEFASSASHVGGWNKDLWNSARMDTGEVNLFPTANNGSVVNLIPGIWAAMYHESDPKFSILGITKFRCFMTVPIGNANSTNILCDGTNTGAYGAPAGYDGAPTTKEFTKIIPDGLLTPGSHVQYFFRKSNLGDPATVFEMGPDTNFVFQNSEASTDGHRWQQFSVLPDRWKDGGWIDAYEHASAPACMLYIDWCDRRGDERIWVSIADSIGATEDKRYGAHNGWHARGDQDITVAIATDPTIARYDHGGQPGSMWDMYGVKASESSTTSSSLGPGALASGFQTGKDDKRGPTGKMLRTYYRVLLILTGDLNAGNIGPYTDKSSNDTGLLNDFTQTAGGTTQPRGVWAMGRNFMEGQMTPGAAAHTAWPPAYFGAGLVSGDYRLYSGNTAEIVELDPVAPINTSTNRYTVVNSCVITNDNLSTVGTFGAAMTAKYPDTSTPPATNPKIASVYAPNVAPHAGVTLVEGFRITQMGSLESITTTGKISYFSNVITNLWTALNCGAGFPTVSTESPNNPLVSFLALRSENPHRGGDAEIQFGITRKERVELKVYDVTGRLVKTLANREFAAGEHTIFWDGSNEDGALVARGVYFYQLRTPTFVSQKKLAVLRH
jgi:hypothetical protein